MVGWWGFGKVMAWPMVRYSPGETEERYRETEDVGVLTGDVSNRSLNHGSGF